MPSAAAAAAPPPPTLAQRSPPPEAPPPQPTWTARPQPARQRAPGPEAAAAAAAAAAAGPQGSRAAAPAAPAQPGLGGWHGPGRRPPRAGPAPPRGQQSRRAGRKAGPGRTLVSTPQSLDRLQRPPPAGSRPRRGRTAPPRCQHRRLPSRRPQRAAAGARAARWRRRGTAPRPAAPRSPAPPALQPPPLAAAGPACCRCQLPRPPCRRPPL